MQTVTDVNVASNWIIPANPSLALKKCPQADGAANQELANKIRRKLLESPQKKFAKVQAIPKAPDAYFLDSDFWKYSVNEAKSCWAYCLSRFRSKEQVIPYVFIGTETYALIGELLCNDYNLKPNAYYKESDPSLELKFKDEGAEQQWAEIKAHVLGSEHEKIGFTRVISVVKDADSAEGLNYAMQKCKKIYGDTQGYSLVKKHKIIQLRDLPIGEIEQQNQIDQWKNVINDLDEICDMINQAREEQEPILIHCKAGRHRSAALIIAYLVTCIGLNHLEAFAWLRRQRPCAIHYGLSEFTQVLTV